MVAADDDEEREDIQYIIDQKTAKKYKKIISAAPLGGTAMAIFQKLRWAYKKARGTQGVKRREVAQRLAQRLKNEEGQALAICGSLYGYKGNYQQTVERLKETHDADVVIYYKLRSV